MRGRIAVKGGREGTWGRECGFYPALSAIKNKKTMLKRIEKRKKNTECDNMGSNVVLIFFAWKPLTDVQVDKDAKVKQKREKT
jgi:hypothetical protein